MASFDLETFLKVLGGAPGAPQGGPVEALGMAFGMPSCLLNLTKNLLGILPGGIVGGILEEAQDALEEADRFVKEKLNDIMKSTGIMEYSTDTGMFKFISDSSKGKLDKNLGQAINNLAGIGSALAYGAAAWANIQNIQNQINSIKDCIDDYKKLKSFEAGSSANEKSNLALLNEDAANELFAAEYAAQQQAIEGALDFINDANALVEACTDVLNGYALDPDSEPQFVAGIIPELDNTTFLMSDDVADEEAEESVFDLVYGPPASKSGQFLLTTDGLYFDSQSGGLDPALVELETMASLVQIGDEWKFEHDPAVGGKGVQISLKEITSYVDTIFDPEKIDDSSFYQDHYDKDHFLQDLISQQNKEIYDVSAHISELLITESANSAIVVNLRHSLHSVIAKHTDKINRRKKQIELAVKTPLLLDPDSQQGISFGFGEVPINDFSYLAQLNYGTVLEKQKKLIFEAGEVTGMVLPLEPKFAIAPQTQEKYTGTDHLVVPTVGKGGLLYSTGGASGTVAPVLSLTDEIVTNDLIAVYNFLQTDIVDPSSTDFLVLNCASDGIVEKNAQLVADSVGEVFSSGLALPYLKGIAEFNTTTQIYPSAVGSYVKLPDIQEFRDLAYGLDGFTVESWVHMPGLDSSSVSGWDDAGASSLHRILLGCEGTGSFGTGISDDTRIAPESGTNYTRGLLMGFTKDRQITENSLPSDSSSNNTGLSFYIAPTQSVNASNAGFVNSTILTDGECTGVPSDAWYKCKVDVTSIAANGTTKFSDTSSSFVCISVAVDPVKDEIRILADGSLIATSSLSLSFGIPKHTPIALPTFTKDNSFEYGESVVASGLGDITPKLAGGPKFNKGEGYSFVPWILGGGYTDGMYDNGNFMGTSSGIRSGLNGYVGSVKFYSRALTTTEALTNFTAQKGFFKNIVV